MNKLNISHFLEHVGASVEDYYHTSGEFPISCEKLTLLTDSLAEYSYAVIANLNRLDQITSNAINKHKDNEVEKVVSHEWIEALDDRKERIDKELGL